MKKLLTLTSIIATALILSSCAVQHRTLPDLNMAFFDHYQANENDSLQYGHFQNLLQLSKNKHLKRWTKNHHYQIIGFNVINTSSQFRKGFELKFYHEGKRITPYRNEWIAKKARQKTGGANLLALPFLLIEKALFHSDEEDEKNEYCFLKEDNDSYLTLQALENNEETCERANSDLLNDLKKHDLSYKTLPFGLPVYGIVIFKSKAPLDAITITL